MSKTSIPCPGCGGRLFPSQPPKYPRPVFRCQNFPACDMMVGSDGNGQPLGTPADKLTRHARIRAHHAFDTYRNKRRWERKEAYRWLQEQMRLTPQRCHIAMFNIDQCNQVVDLCTPASKQEGLV